MRMRKSVWAGAAIVLALTAAPVGAAKLKFSPSAFQVYGGMASGGKAELRAPSHDALLHRTVPFRSNYEAGSLVIRTGERRLYFVLSADEAIEYRVGVGREGYEWSGTNHISGKAEWPDWRPPREMIEREAERGHDIPDFMPGGPDNPLGARAIYIGDTQYRIHGTTQPWSIGRAMSSGCIRMMNEEVIDLYDRVKVGSLVVVEP